MSDEQTLHTRRQFLRTTLLGGAVSGTIPAFLAQTISALHAEAAQKVTQITTGRDGTILVVLQMAGGNDGLNTVVPYASDDYRRARPRLGLAAGKVLKLNDQLGLHPNLTGFQQLYEAGQLAIVQGVGYPNPNRSHFRSTEIWQTASSADRYERYGWLGRYFDNACPGADPAVGVSIGRQSPAAFAGKAAKGICLENPQKYRFLARGRPGEAVPTEAAYRKLNDAQEAMTDAGPGANSGGTISALSGSVMPSGSAVDFLERVALEAQVSSDTIRAISDRVENRADYPGSELANSLKLVARLIGGGLPARVFYVSQGGYDTHTNQLATQDRLLRDLGDSVRAFVQDLTAQGNLERVLVMTFSEFGRRVAENASGGTDHGAAAPIFVIGHKIKSGLLGRYPSLAPADLFQGDLKFHVDFRSVYATVLENWLQTPSEPILGQRFPTLGLV